MLYIMYLFACQVIQNFFRGGPGGGGGGPEYKFVKRGEPNHIIHKIVSKGEVYPLGPFPNHWNIPGHSPHPFEKP